MINIGSPARSPYQMSNSRKHTKFILLTSDYTLSNDGVKRGIVYFTLENHVQPLKKSYICHKYGKVYIANSLFLLICYEKFRE